MNQSKSTNQAPVFCQDKKSNVWSKIDDYIKGSYPKDSNFYGPLNALFGMEQIRQDGKSDNTGKLSSEWFAHKFHFPGLNALIKDYANTNKFLSPADKNKDKILKCLTPVVDDEGNDTEGLEITFLGYKKDKSLPKKRLLYAGKANKHFLFSEIYRAAFTSVRSTGHIAALALANDQSTIEAIIPENMYDYIQKDFGLEDAPHSDIGWQETLGILTKYFKDEEIRKDLICVKPAPNPVVMTRDAYEFVNYYLQSVAKIDGRLPSLNYHGFNTKWFKVPTAMKNFRFDITNIRALEAATSLTQESFVYYINRLLKQYLATEVALKLDSLTYSEDPAEEISPVGADEIYQKFRKQTANFGFTGPESIKDLKSDKQVIIDELKSKILSEKIAHKKTVERSNAATMNLSKSNELNKALQAMVDETTREIKEGEIARGQYQQDIELKIKELAAENQRLTTELRRAKATITLNSLPPLNINTKSGKLSLGGDNPSSLNLNTESPISLPNPPLSLLDQTNSIDVAKMMKKFSDGLMERIDERIKQQFEATVTNKPETKKPKSKTKPKSKKSAS